MFFFISLYLVNNASADILITDSDPCANSTITRLNYGTWDPNSRTCTLNGNVNESIVINGIQSEIRDLTLDCSGNTVSLGGIIVQFTDNVTIKNCIVTGNIIHDSGSIFFPPLIFNIEFFQVENFTLLNNVVVGDGIFLDGQIIESGVGFEILGPTLNTISSNLIINNTFGFRINFGSH